MKSHEEREIHLLWSSGGESVALVIDDVPFSFIAKGEKRGYSRLLKKQSCWGNLWNEHLFAKLFAPGGDDRSYNPYLRLRLRVILRV